MLQADPQLAWLKEAEQRGDVNWKQVKELHEHWQYSQAGLGPAAQLAIAIAASALGGMAAAGALSSAGVGAASSLSSTAISLINHKGDLGQVLKDSLSNSFAAAGFNFVGDISQARGESFATGAVAAGANEALVGTLDQAVKYLSPQNQEALLSLNSQLIGLVATAVRNPEAPARI